jgi:phosphotriesterase-related protein
MHAHLACDLYSHHHDERYRDFVTEIDEMEVELVAYREAGGHALVELTPMGLGRDPAGMAHLARRSGVHVVAGTGVYHESFHPAAIAGLDDVGICLLFVREVTNGMDGTGVRAGIIGEIGTTTGAITPREAAVFRAAAWAARETGVAVTTHTVFGALALEQIDVLTRAGLDADRIVIGHLDDIEPDLELCREIIRRGAWVQFDTVGFDYYSEALGTNLMPDDERLRWLLALADEGLGDRIIVASDLCRRRHLRRNGGPGLVHLADGFWRLAREEGVPESLLRSWMIDNAASVLALR